MDFNKLESDKYMVGIRVDGNSIIATGHIMRCMAIAKAIEKLGEKVIFIIADEYSKKLITQSGFEYYCLHTKYDNLDLEIKQMEWIIEEKNIDKILVDSYFASENYLITIRKKAFVIYIDDIGKSIYPVDIIINYCLFYKKFCYEKKYLKENTKFLLGCKYVPIREQFLNISRKSIENKCSGKKKIMITTGGTDCFNIAGKVGKKLAETFELKDTEILIISGKFNDHFLELKKLSNEFNNITVMSDVKNMAELMQLCDYAISAGGTTLYELCYCGIPTVCFAFSDNQIESVEEFGNEGIMINVGDVRDNIDKSIDNICVSVVELYRNINLQNIYRNKMKMLVDGKGTERIAYEIIKL